MENPERRNIVNTKKERKTLEWLEGTKFHSLGGNENGGGFAVRRSP